MAVLRVGNGFSLDMTYLDIGALAYGETTSASANHMVLEYDATTHDEFYGSFTYDNNGILSGGTLTDMQEFVNGQLAFEITGFSVGVGTFIDWIDYQQTLQALNGLLGGNDTLIGNSLPDALIGFNGNDSISGGDGGDLISGEAGNDTLSGGDGGDYVIGMDGNDQIDGGAGNDDVNGNMGADTVRGGAGSDYVRGGKDNDVIYGDDGDDFHLNGNLGNDIVFGGAGNDNCFGGQGDDQINGEAGSDYISGDLGNDTLTGGAGADGFFIAVGGGNDRVTDFNSAQGDRVLLNANVAYNLHQVGSDMVIDLNGASLTLVGVSQAALGNDWLVVV
jgi:Ca2+-binding RTX toxin-like protein